MENVGGEGWRRESFTKENICKTKKVKVGTEKRKEKKGRHRRKVAKHEGE